MFINYLTLVGTEKKHGQLLLGIGKIIVEYNMTLNFMRANSNSINGSDLFLYLKKIQSVLGRDIIVNGKIACYIFFYKKMMY